MQRPSCSVPFQRRCFFAQGGLKFCPRVYTATGEIPLKTFHYQPVTSTEEAVALLAKWGDRARPLAGGTDLLVQLREGRFNLDVLVDVKKIPALNELSFDPTNGLTIGAAVPCCQIYQDPQVRAHYPALVDAASIIGGVAIQGRATFGGNLCNAAPSGDSVPGMIVHYGVCHIQGPQGQRTVPVEAFNLAPKKTVLEPGELLVSIQFPAPPPHSGSCHQRFIPRHEMDIAVVGCASFVVLDEGGTTIESARLALATVAPIALLVEEAGEALRGKLVSEETIETAARIAQDAARPRTTLRGTTAQRRHLVGVLAKRTLWTAISRAKGENDHDR